MGIETLQAEVLCWTWYLQANPVGALSLVDTGDRRELGLNLADWLRDPGTTPRIFGDAARLAEEWRTKCDDEPPEVSPVEHVFPIWCEPLRMGIVVPLKIVTAQDWRPAEIFATFDVKGRSADAGLLELLERISAAWASRHGAGLPLRWRSAFSIHPVCPVHPDALRGESHQVPLCLALLRAIAASRQEGEAPFGRGPVFATGTLRRDGRFGRIEFLAEKLAGFVREYGVGRHAVLTSAQRKELASHRLLAQVQVHEANDLVQLLELPEIQLAMQKLAGRPSAVEIDSLLGTMERLERSVRFEDASEISSWLMEHVSSPCQRYRLHRYVGLTRMHRGEFSAARRALEEAQALIDRQPELFTAEMRAALACIWASLAIDSCRPESGLAAVEGFVENLGTYSIERRLKLLGTLCQLHRILGNHDRAIECGVRAVGLADEHSPGESGRSRNYLVHAHIERYRTGGKAPRDLEAALTLLQESRERFAPEISRQARESHLEFCRHFEAELARLARKRHEPSVSSYQGAWAHAPMFVLLACARNEANSRKTRLACARKLASSSARFRSSRSVYGLLESLFRLVLAHVTETDGADARSDLREWCSRHAREGENGWQQSLGPRLDGSLDDLLAAIPWV